MTISRRNILLGATASAALLPKAAGAQTSEVVIGLTYPLSGANAQIGVDAQKAYETAAEIINKNYDFDLPLAKGEGLPGLGGAKVRLVFADHQSDP
jgi:branched-chain amino acid transport system substrate-binding protein